MLVVLCPLLFFFFFFNDTATTEIYTLSLHDALPICELHGTVLGNEVAGQVDGGGIGSDRPDRKSTRLNSSHSQISYAVFCLKKKNKNRESGAGLAMNYCGQVQSRLIAVS